MLSTTGPNSSHGVTMSDQPGSVTISDAGQARLFQCAAAVYDLPSSREEPERGSEMQNQDLIFKELASIMSQPWMKELIEDEENHPNFWSIIEYGNESYETRYSRMLRWLMDPHGNHGLGRFFALNLAGLVAERSQDSALSTLVQDHRDRDAQAHGGSTYEPGPRDGADVEALKSDSGGIDVLAYMESLSLVIAVENKMFAGEEPTQLDRYHAALGQHPEYKEYKHRALVYLTGDGRDPLAGEESPWIPVKYSDLRPLLETTYKRLGDTATAEDRDIVRSQHARKIVQDFIWDSRKKFSTLKGRDEIAVFKGHFKDIVELRIALGDGPEPEVRGGPDDDSAASVTPTSDHDDLKREFFAYFEGDARDAKVALRLVADAVTVQDKTPNENVQSIVRELFYLILGGDEARNVDYANATDPHPLDDEIFAPYGVKTVQVTSKRQGIYLYIGETKFRGYVSGSSDGTMPNDGISLHLEPTLRKRFKDRGIEFPRSYVLPEVKKINASDFTGDGGPARAAAYLRDELHRLIETTHASGTIDEVTRIWHEATRQAPDLAPAATETSGG